MRKHRLLPHLLALAAVLVAGCTTALGPGGAQTCQPLAEATPTPTATGSGVLVVTDTSGSMNGFAQPASVRLYTLHDSIERAARGAVAAAEPSPAIRRCYLGESLNCQSPVGLRDLDRASTYNARESRLDLFMRAPDQAAAGGNAAEAADPLDPYRISVLVTDGMQARKANAAEGTPCLAGADPDCMAHLLRQRGQQGYGIWLALLLMPFKGTHYPERPLDEAIWQRVQQHVSGLGEDPFYRGVNFKVARAGTAVPFESYQFEGVKPVVVLALSRDLGAGRAFIRQFVDTIRREAVVQPAGALYTMELAPLSVRPRRVGKISLASGAPVEGARPVTSQRKGGLYDYLIECDRNCSAALTATTEEQEGEQTVGDNVAVAFNLAPAGGSLPPRNLQAAAAPGGAFELRLSGQQLKEGSFEACLDLRAELKPEPPPGTFWAALHWDNMYEAPERLYGLREMVEKVLRAVTEQPRVTDRVRFRVERK